MGADNFTVPDAEIDTVSVRGTTATIKLKNFIPNNVTVFFEGLMNDGEEVPLAPTGVNTDNVEIPYLELDTEQELVALDPETDTASVELTTRLNNFPAGAEATIEFDTNAEVAQITGEETTSEQGKTIRLVVSDLTEKKQIKVTATIKEVKNPDNGDVFDDYKENVAAVDKTVTFSPNIDDVDDPDAHSYKLKKAVANQADRLTVWVNKDVTKGLIEHLNENTERILVDDNLSDEESYIPVEKIVKTGSDKLLVILDSGAAGARSNFPLDDNVNHKVEFDGDYSDGYILSGGDEFFLEDSNYIKLTDVYTSQTDTDLSDDQLKVVFSEPVNNLTIDDDLDSAKYSVRNLKNWVIDGINLGNKLPSQMNTDAIFPADVNDEVSIKVEHSNEDKLTRDVVILTFETPEEDVDEDDKVFENVQSFLSEGSHNLQVNTLGDWASVTNDANMVSTLNDEYEGIPTSDVSVEWKMDSPEQFVVEFSGTVLDSEGEIDGDNFEIIIPDQDVDEKPYDADAFAVLTAGEQNADALPDKTFEDGEEITDAFTITELTDKKYLIEMNYDWTQLYNTEGTENNYHMQRFNPLRLRVKGLKDAFGYNLADDPNELDVKPDLDLAEDTASPVLEDSTILTTVKNDTSETDKLDESDSTILDSTSSGPITVSKDAGAVKLDFNEPVQVKDQNGNQHEGSTVLTTPSQQQDSANGGVKEMTLEYVNQETGNTVEGTVAKVAAKGDKEQERDYSLIVVPVDDSAEDEDALADGMWRLVVRDITDDVGNAMSTETIKDIEITTAADDGEEEDPEPSPEKPFDLIKVDAHYDVTEWLDDYNTDEEDKNDAKDLIHVQFNKPVALTGVASPLKKSNWRLNGEALPIEGTRIEKGILGAVDGADLDIDDDGEVEDLDQTQYAVTIILPDGYLETHNNNHILTLIDVEDATGASLSERVVTPYVDDTNGNAFVHPVE
ncbi:MAG: hypothetical protein R6V17_00435 [Halanaerobacter sp.]